MLDICTFPLGGIFTSYKDNAQSQRNPKDNINNKLTHRERKDNVNTTHRERKDK